MKIDKSFASGLAVAALSVGFLAGACSTASAALLTFTDRATWQAAVSSPTTLEDFNAFVADAVQPVDLGLFSVSAVGAFAQENGIEAFDPNSGDIQPDRNIDGTSYYSGDVDLTVITFLFDVAIFAIGWDQGSTDGGNVGVNINAGGDSANLGDTAFFGVVSDTAFSQFTLDGDDVNFALDNLEFAAASVPEPGTLALFGLALASLAGLGSARRKSGY